MAEDIAVLGIEARTRGLAEAERDLLRLENAGGRAERSTISLSGAMRTLSGVAATLGLAAMARDFVQTADQMSMMNARLRIVTKSASEFEHVQSELFRRSQESRSSLQATSDLYVSMARATDGLGLSQTRLLDLTEGIGKAFVVSGTDAGTMSGALRQLSQALQSGVLRGDEFNSMMEGAPRLMQAIAEGMGKPVGALRDLAQAGKLTTDVVLPALEIGLQKVGQEFDRMPLTVGQAQQQLSDAFSMLVSDADGATGATSLLAGTISGLADSISIMKPVLDAAIGSFDEGTASADSFGRSIGDGLATVFETITVLGGNVAFVMRGIGTEIGGIAAQVAAFVSGDFSGATAIGRMMKEDAAAARAEFDKWEAGVMNARSNAAALNAVMTDARRGVTDYGGTVGRLIDLQNAGTISAAQFKQAVESMQPPLKGATNLLGGGGGGKGGLAGAAKKAADEAKKLAEAGAELALSLTAQSSGLSGDFIKKWNQLGAAYKAGKISLDQLTSAQAKLLEQQPAIKKGLDDQAKAAAELDKAWADYRDGWSSYLDDLDKSARSLALEVEHYGKTELQIAAVNTRRAEEQLLMAKRNGVAADHLAAMEREVELYRQIQGSIAEKATLDANKQAADAAADDWKRTAQSIESAIYDALISGGEDAGEVLKRTFKAMVLEPMIRPIAQAGSQMVMGLLGMGGQAAGIAGAAGSGGGIGGMPIPGGMSILSGGLQMLGGAMGSASLTSFGAGMGMSAAQISGLSGAGLLSGGAATAGMMFAKVLPWVGGALMLANALGAFKGPTYHSGAAVGYGTDNRAVTLGHKDQFGDTRVWGGFSETDAKGGGAFASPLKDLAKGVTDTIEGVFKQFGQGGQVSAFAAFGADGDDKSRGSMRVYDAAGNLLGANSDQALRGKKYSKDAEKGFAEFAADSAKVIRDALVAADLPGWVDSVLTSLGDGVGMDQLNAALSGIEMIQGKTLTANELWQKATQGLADEFGKLGYAMPNSISAFNELIKSSDELGAELFALAPAFYELASIVDATFASISATTAASVRDIEMAMLDQAGKYQYLDTEIVGLIDKLAGAFDPGEIQGLFEQINQKTMQAYNLLDAEEQKRLGTKFIDRLYEAETLAQERLSVTPLDYEPTIVAADSQQTAAEKTAAAAESLSTAAEALSEAIARFSLNGDQSAIELRGAAGALSSAASHLGGAASNLGGAARSFSAEVGVS